MTRPKRILVLAWHDDQRNLEETCGLALSNRPALDFDARHWFEAALDEADIQNLTTRFCDATGSRILAEVRNVQPEAIVVFLGPAGHRSSQFAASLLQVAGWSQLNGLTPTFVFVLATELTLLQFHDGSFRNNLGTSSRKFSSSAAENENRIAVSINELRDCLDRIFPTKPSSAQVGLGVFLVSDDGHVHLSERYRSPSPNIGTIGGVITPEKGIKETLEEIVRKRFVEDPGELCLGPLLACTNMKQRAEDRRHYVDLTFLATISQKPERLRSAQHRPIDDRKSVWFPFSRVTELSHQGRLYPPVENAYRALHRMITSHVAANDRITPLMNLHVLSQPGIARIIRDFDDGHPPAAPAPTPYRPSRLSGFLFDDR